MASAVKIDRDGDVGVITLDHPPLNLFDADLINGLMAATIEEAEGEMLRALVIQAEGKVFTGGVDVEVFDDKTPEQAAALFRELVAMVHKLEAMPFPTIASVHGLCLTAGLELALGCDLLFASESAQFGLVERVVGLTPAMGGTQRMAERAGPARAREFVMSGDLYDAATLERWNVVNRVYPDDELREKTMKFAQRLATGPTKAHAATKAMVRRVPRRGRPGSRRGDRRHRGAAVRHRRPAEGRRHVPGGGTGKGHVRGAVTPHFQPKTAGATAHDAGSVSAAAGPNPVIGLEGCDTQMATGTVKWFNDEKGYGFITPDDGGRDLFVHHTGINGDGFKTLREASKVTYEEEQSDKGPKAVNVETT